MNQSKDLEIAKLKDRIAFLESEKRDYVKLLKAFNELIEYGQTLHERMGIERSDFEYQWVEKAGLM